MPAPIDISNQRFDRLVVVERNGRSKKGEWLWRCKCDCGNEATIGGYDLRSGHSASCGCATREAVTNRSTTHGLTRSPEYRSWLQMRRRCRDKTAVNYERYGGRGIKVCERWQDSFEAFLSDMGTKPTPEHSIDRIDTNGNYEPGNCRWATATEQSRNRRPRKRSAT